MRARVLLVVPALALVAAVNLQRGHEADALAACRADADAQVQHLVDRALGVERYAGSALDAPGTPARVRASLEQLVTGSVAADLPDVLAVRERCRFWALPWGATAEARDAYVGRLDARLAVLRRAATDRDALHDPVLFSP